MVRRPRGVINLSHKLHSDVNGALNIWSKESRKRVEKAISFFISSNGVTPIKGSN
ncbi:transposase, partial [Sulfolobus sp. A20-N-G8]